MKNTLKIACPNCGHQFSPEAAIEAHVRAHLEKELAQKNAESVKLAEKRARENAEAEFQARIESLEKDRQLKTEKLREMEKLAVSLQQRESLLAEREEHLELDMKKKLLEESDKIRRNAEKLATEKARLEFREKEEMYKREKESLELSIRKESSHQVEKVREEERMKYAELQKKLEDQTRLADEMKRKAEQGSMQLQGEVQELAIEEFLKTTFPKDEVQEISKGVRGADCLHVVKDNFGNECGKILYESKRTKAFSRDWIAKLKEDVRLRGANVGVIVTEAMPGDMQRFGEIDGIWICSFAEFKSVSLLLRATMLRIGEVLASQENKGDKMQMLYDYLTGDEFRQRIEAISEAFGQMNHDLQKERSQALTNFAKREKQILKVMENTVALYGEVRGIGGGGVQVVEALEGEDVLVLRQAG
jgi:hypothetical protein